MEYRTSPISGVIYRRRDTTNDVLTPWGWQLAVFLLGAGGWQQIMRMTVPCALDPAWPA